MLAYALKRLGVALLVALTVVPVLVARDSGAERARRSPGLELYENLLDRCLSRPRAVIAATLAFLAGTALCALLLPREVVPETNEERLDVRLTLPPDADLTIVSARSEEVETALAGDPEISRVLADLGERDDARLDLDPRPPYAGDLTAALAAGAVPEKVLRRLASRKVPPDVEIEARPVKTQLENCGSSIRLFPNDGGADL